MVNSHFTGSILSPTILYVGSLVQDKVDLGPRNSSMSDDDSLYVISEKVGVSGDRVESTSLSLSVCLDDEVVDNDESSALSSLSFSCIQFLLLLGVGV